MNDVSKGLFILVTFILLHFIVDNIDINLDDDDSIVEGFSAKDAFKKTKDEFKKVDNEFKKVGNIFKAIGNFFKSLVKFPQQIAKISKMLFGKVWAFPACIFPGGILLFPFYILKRWIINVSILFLVYLVYVSYLLFFSLPVRLARGILPNSVDKRLPKLDDKKFKKYIENKLNDNKKDNIKVLLYFLLYAFYLVPVILIMLSNIPFSLFGVSLHTGSGGAPVPLFEPLHLAQSFSLFPKPLDILERLIYIYLGYKILDGLPKNKTTDKFFELFGLKYIIKIAEFIRFILIEIYNGIAKKLGIFGKILKKIIDVIYIACKYILNILIKFLIILKTTFLYIIKKTWGLRQIANFMVEKYKFYRGFVLSIAIFFALGFIIRGLPNPETKWQTSRLKLSNIFTSPLPYVPLASIRGVAFGTLVFMTFFKKELKYCFKMYDEVKGIKKILSDIFSVLLSLLKMF